jgi:hypothetical protein
MRGIISFSSGHARRWWKRPWPAFSKTCPLLRIAGWHRGYFWDDEESVVEEIPRSGARLLFVAISSAKFEGTYHKIAFPLNPRIDYIFVSPRIAVDQAGVLPRSAGDHFPVRAALKKSA